MATVCTVTSARVKGSSDGERANQVQFDNCHVLVDQGRKDNRAFQQVCDLVKISS